MRLLHDESGFSLPELLVVMTITGILMGGLATIFGIGLNTGKTSRSFIASQGGVQIGLDRLDYEARCASSARLVSGGVGVTLTFPQQCTHASGTATWCVTGTALVRYSGSACSGSGQTLATSVTSTTPFSCVAPVGVYPALKVIMSVNTGLTSTTAFTGTDTISLENAILTTSSSTGCS
jgi:prepilin-type N-terminal cleavage/methylation domain-containing protein